jgi:hypothetical protein
VKVSVPYAFANGVYVNPPLVFQISEPFDG